MIPSPFPPPVLFSELVESVETQARFHVGQAKVTVLTAFGDPFLDPFERSALNRALLRVHEARSDGERLFARGMLARALSMVQARAGQRVAS